ncbi:urease accessory protein UreF [Rhodococcus rhodnii]|uniref:urease accessory protein UreF n=1 Tax=Rhodococcus rhodnii TaxID=38312 RepID=UPI000B083CB5|nr:urease accessory UreF family protein [Rhodococcus rhodnii]
MSDPQLVLAMLADARLPTGGHAHSAGLEPAILAGLAANPRRLHEIPDLARTRLRTITTVEAAAAVAARAAWLRGEYDLSGVETAWCARTPSAAMRDTARQLGRGYLRLARGLWPDAFAGFTSERPVRPVVLGVVGAVAGLDARQVALLVGYDDVQTIASAALKLVPLDPAQAMRWVLDLHPDIAAMADEIAHVESPGDIPARSAPVLDDHAEAHARTTRRLFHA